LLQEPVALQQRLVLSERERVDRPHEPQFSLQLAGPARQGDSVRSLGLGRGDRGVGLAIEVAPHLFHRLLEAQSDLGLLHLELSRPLAQLRQPLLGLRATLPQPVETTPGLARRFRLLATPGPQALGQRLDRTGARPEPFRNLRDRFPAPLQSGASGASTRFFVRPNGEASLDLSESRREYRPALLDRRTSQLVVAAPGRGMRAKPLQLGTPRARRVTLFRGSCETRAGVRLRKRSGRARSFELVGARGERDPASIESRRADLYLPPQLLGARGELLELDAPTSFVLR